MTDARKKNKKLYWYNIRLENLKYSYVKNEKTAFNRA